MTAVRGRVVGVLEARGIELAADSVDRLTAYFEHLRTWNRRLNLVGFDLDAGDATALSRILEEPLVAAADLSGIKAMLDVGSGGGTPGIPLGIALNVSRIDLVESRSKKATFLREALRVSRTPGNVFACRFEDLTESAGPNTYDLLSVRAVRLDAAFWFRAAALMSKPGSIVLWFHSGSQRPSDVPPEFVVARSMSLGRDAVATILDRRPA